jgi:uridine kinase
MNFFFWRTHHIAPLDEYYHNSKNTTFQERGKPNFNLISLNFEEPVTTTIKIFEYKEVP